MGKATRTEEAKAEETKEEDRQEHSSEVRRPRVRAEAEESGEEDVEEADAEEALLTICLLAIENSDELTPDGIYNVLETMQLSNVWDLAQLISEETEVESDDEEIVNDPDADSE